MAKVTGSATLEEIELRSVREEEVQDQVDGEQQSLPKPDGLVPLFEAELAYRGDMEPVVSSEGRDGVLIGSGDGVVEGQRLKGTIRWSFYSGDCAYLLVRAGLEGSPDQHLCTATPGGIIETEDGAVIRFDARGYGLRGWDKTRPHLWSLTMGLQFATTDERYLWLNDLLATWIGEFDERVGRARYRAFVDAAALLQVA
ncbi:MAG: hypothetical protein V3R48_07350 [Thermoplasmata archaeon]